VSDGLLDGVEERLTSLDERPLGEHADVLEQLHGALVAELDALVIAKAASGSQRPASAG
jgi:hypothetical protein